MAKDAPVPVAMKNFQAEVDLRCLRDAEKIKNNEQRYAAALACAKDEQTALAEVLEEADEEDAENEKAPAKKKPARKAPARPVSSDSYTGVMARELKWPAVGSKG